MGTKLSCLLILLSFLTKGQEWTFVRKVDLGQEITAISSSKTGKVYFGTVRGNVYSLFSDGTKDTNYSSAIFQPVSSLDASNALRVFVFYAATGQFEYLERFSAQSRTYELPDFGLNQASLATLGINQSIWFLSGNTLSQINPVNQLVLQELQLPDSLASGDISDLKFRRTQLAISKPAKGLYFFSSDLSNFIFQPLLGVNYFQFFENEILALGQDALIRWNPITGKMDSQEPPRNDFERLSFSDGYYQFTRGSEVWIYQLTQ